MNRILPLLALGACLALPALAQQTSGAAGTPPPPPSSSNGGPPPGGHMGGLTPEEHQELMADRQAAFQADPALAAEAKDLEEKTKAHQKKLDAAMIKIDPKVAPLLTKMEAAHMHHDGAGGPPPPPPKQ